MGDSKTYKPGEKAEISGTYDLLDASGSKMGTSVKMSANDHFPPTGKSGQRWSLRSSK